MAELNFVCPMSLPNTSGKDGLRVLVTMASAVIVIAGLQAGRDVFLPIVMATFLAVASFPITKLLRDKCHFPHWLAVFFTVLVDCGFLVGLGFMSSFLAGQLSRIWQEKYNDLLTSKYADFLNYLQEKNWDLQARELVNSTLQNFDGQNIVNMTTTLLGKATSMLTITALVLILMTFFLGEAPKFGENVKRISKKSGPGILNFANALSGIQKYLVIKTMISLATGLCAWCLCAIIGVDLPLLWGILAFALNFIPTFGSIVAAIPPIILSLLMLGPSEAVFVAAGYLAINTAFGNLIEPLLMGRQFGIATSVVLLSVVFWGWVWGPIGMLLAVPISILVKLGLEGSRDLSWIAMLMDDPPKKRNINIPGLPPSLIKNAESLGDTVAGQKLKSPDQE